MKVSMQVFFEHWDAAQLSKVETIVNMLRIRDLPGNPTSGEMHPLHKSTNKIRSNASTLDDIVFANKEIMRRIEHLRAQAHTNRVFEDEALDLQFRAGVLANLAWAEREWTGFMEDLRDDLKGCKRDGLLHLA